MIMKINFDIPAPRRGTDCEKWDGMVRNFGEAAAGDDVIPLWVADMDFLCAPEILSAVRSSLDSGALGYRTLPASFFEAISGWMKKRHDLDVPTEQILPVPGVVSGISAILGAVTQPGDGVIIQTPVYTPFYNVPRNLGRRLMENPLIESEKEGILRYEMDFEHLAALCADPSAKAMILCSPHNPLGRLWTKEELRRVADICAANGVFLISDEIHSDIILGGKAFTPILHAAAQKKGIAQLCSPSKSFNTAGMHAAYMIVPDGEDRAQIRAYRRTLHDPDVSFMANEVICAAYNEAEYYADELCAYITGNMEFLTEYLQKHLPRIRLTKPEATYLLWTDLSAYGIEGDALMDRMLRVGRIAPDPGVWFGEKCTGCLRINVAAPRAMIEEAARRIVGCF